MFGIERTYQWLGRDNVPLGFTTRALVDNIHTAIAKSKFERALDLLDDLQAAINPLDDCARAYVHLGRARAYNKMHETEQALQELEAADKLLKAIDNPNQCCRHNQALVNWMLGGSFWQNPGQRQHALETWQKALELFQILSHDSNTLDPGPDWYKDRVAEMQDHFLRALQGPQPTPARPRASSRPVTMPRVVLQPGSLKYIDVLGSIRASDFGPNASGPQPIDRVALQPSIDEFMIEGNPHYLYNLRGPSQIITLQSSMPYFILKVNGDSMDKAGIDPGDYIILRHQDSASYGDIAAAEIFDVDDQATLKTYTRVREANGNEKVLLLPQSNNEDHDPILITKSDQVFIGGVALGVFKPTT